MSKAILVLGATGKQGGATVQALLNHSDFSAEQYTILAVTRKPSSDRAQKLATLSSAITLVKGDPREPAALFSNLPILPWAMFLMTNAGKTESQDGIVLTDGAIEAGVTRIVFSSVDRGRDSGPTNVPHFESKHCIEEHLRSVVSESKGAISYTIIRPPFFLDNLEPGFFGKLVATSWRDSTSNPMALVDTQDIGNYAAAALLEREGSGAYHNAEYNIAGDRLTFADADRIFTEKTGKKLPKTSSFWPRLLMLLNKDFGKMAKFWEIEGFKATPEATTLHEMTDFRQWIDRSRHSRL